MKKLYELVVSVLGSLRSVIERVERRDRDLARQLRRAGASVLLNLAESTHHKGGHRNERLHTAEGSLREVRAALEVAIAFAYIDRQSVRGILDQVDHAIAITWIVLHRPKAA